MFEGAAQPIQARDDEGAGLMHGRRAGPAPLLYLQRRMTMHVAVEFPLATQRWGTEAVLELARAIEDAGYDEIDLFEHVTVGLPIPGRSETREAAPELLEPLVTVGAISAVTQRIRLGTGILVLPRDTSPRHP
jgi:alkanesulfonate monooxygenase SsuD/methylene tetrahydromethanopterin reductase-like flavin-dependent oxidoreductase (luciferase family)